MVQWTLRASPSTCNVEIILFKLCWGLLEGLEGWRAPPPKGPLGVLYDRRYRP